MGSDGVLIGMGSVRLGFDRCGFRSDGVLIAWSYDGGAQDCLR